MTRCERGLGLLELIVALMLVTLASTLVMQGIGQGLGMLRRVANDQGVAYHELMARAWLRESVAAAAAQAATVSSDGSDQQEGDAEPSRPAEPPRPVFAGTAATLEMQSFRPLLGAEGVATPIRWSADPQQGLRYDEGDQQVLVDALPPLQRIEYQGPDGNWQAQWPPADAPLAGDPQADASASPSELPVRVRFDFGDDDRLDVLLLARHSARAEADDMEVEVD
jgi:hypothetical protein